MEGARGEGRVFAEGQLPGAESLVLTAREMQVAAAFCPVAMTSPRLSLVRVAGGVWLRHPEGCRGALPRGALPAPRTPPVAAVKRDLPSGLGCPRVTLGRWPGACEEPAEFWLLVISLPVPPEPLVCKQIFSGGKIKAKNK